MFLTGQEECGNVSFENESKSMVHYKYYKCSDVKITIFELHHSKVASSSNLYFVL